VGRGVRAGLFDRVQSAPQVGPFGFGAGEVECLPVGRRGLGEPAEALEEVGPGGRVRVVAA
jgi:hypothetical protein